VTNVICTATDTSGNTSSAAFSVTVVDTTPPVITAVPANVTQEATSASGAAVSFGSATATDAVTASPTIVYKDGATVVHSGDTFALGVHTITVQATDAAGNVGTKKADGTTASFTITVVDTTPPSLTVPPNMTVKATYPSGATVTYTATATDLVSGSVPVTCSPASGSTFPLGTTTVNCTATDAKGNTGTASFTVTVYGAFLQPDPSDPTKMALVVDGTSDNDTIQIKPVKGSSQVEVFLKIGTSNTTSLGQFGPTGHIIVLGLGGNDTITVDSQISLPQYLNGDGGDDNITSGNGPSILIGGDGNDTLTSGNGRDILFGGRGADTLNGGNGDDILIAGRTSYDDYTTANLTALLAIQKEWVRTDQSYTQRISHLKGTTTGGLNESSYLTTGASATVFDDAIADILTGGLGQDWYFARVGVDTNDRTDGEVVEPL
jgi:Ca2+-binding RTX toxin-like protein